MFRKLLLSVTAAVALAFAAPAQAVPTTGLYLTMDGSGSISDAAFASQIASYHGALDAAIPAVFGQVAIGGAVFGGNSFEFFAPQVINSALELDALTAAIDALVPGRGGIDTGSTAIGDAVTASAASLLAFETAQGVPLTLVIDVTTDGQNNAGSDPATASGAAVAAGIDSVNCLGIGAGADCSFVAGFGTDFGTVSFANLEAALAAKIKEETRIPEPASMLLLGTALAGLGFMRRRRRTA